MAPKKGTKKAQKSKEPIQKPVVSDSDYQEAKKALEDQEELKRQRANLSYYLQAKGQKNQHDTWDNATKKEFLILHLADKMASNSLKGTLKVRRSVKREDKSKRWYEWWNKKQMLDRWGPEKTEARSKWCFFCLAPP